MPHAPSARFRWAASAPAGGLLAVSRIPTVSGSCCRVGWRVAYPQEPVLCTCSLHLCSGASLEGPPAASAAWRQSVGQGGRHAPTRHRAELSGRPARPERLARAPARRLTRHRGAPPPPPVPVAQTKPTIPEPPPAVAPPWKKTSKQQAAVALKRARQKDRKLDKTPAEEGSEPTLTTMLARGLTPE
eukprot:COSAG06_NODE_610_length_13844_cov_14.456359_14_plen_187_part_00